MKVTMRLTMDGLVHALRAKAHRAAEEAESGLRTETERDMRRRRAALRRRAGQRGRVRHDSGQP